MNVLNTITFTSRATYIQFVSDWKAQHAQLIVDIRAAKIAIKETNRAIDGGRNISSVWSAYSNLRKLRGDIGSSEALRASAKVEAQQQYLAEHAVELTV